MNYILACESIDDITQQGVGCSYVVIESLMSGAFAPLIGDAEMLKLGIAAVLSMYGVGLATGIILSTVRKLR